MGRVILKPGREKSLLRHHPWIFSRAIAAVNGNVRPGDTVDAYSSDGKCLGRGAYSPNSQITVRMWTFDPEEEITASFFVDRIDRAVNRRRTLLAGDNLNAYRIVNAESDGLPGLIVDRYADYLVCQFTTVGAEHWRHTIVSTLQDLFFSEGVYERSDVGVRRKEGLKERVGLLAGREPPELIEVREGDACYLVDVRQGHKTGFYLDQRENRALVGSFARDSDFLNCFSYTGGFGIAALKGGARHVVNIDTSATALDLARRNIALNNFDAEHAELVEGNVFHILRAYRDASRIFDIIVLDPPKFAESRSQVQRASRGYKDINRMALNLIKPGGLLFTFSCSGSIETTLFQKIVADAALDAGREAQIIGRLSQASDHPVALNFPEGDYLKGLVCRV